MSYAHDDRLTLMVLKVAGCGGPSRLMENETAARRMS